MEPNPYLQEPYPPKISYEKRAFEYISAMDDGVSSIGGKTIDDALENGIFEDVMVDNDPSVALESTATGASLADFSNMSSVNPQVFPVDDDEPVPRSNLGGLYGIFQTNKQPEEVAYNKRSSGSVSVVSSLAETIDDCVDAMAGMKVKKDLEDRRILMEFQPKHDRLEPKMECVGRSSDENQEKFVIVGVASFDTPGTDSTVHSNETMPPTNSSETRSKKRPPVTILKKKAIEKENQGKPLPFWVKATCVLSTSLFILSVGAILIAIFGSHQTSNNGSTTDSNDLSLMHPTWELQLRSGASGNGDNPPSDIFAGAGTAKGRNAEGGSRALRHVGLRGRL